MDMQAMARVLVIDGRRSMAALLVKRLRASRAVEKCQRASQTDDGFGGHLSGGRARLLTEGEFDTVIYSPPLRSAEGDDSPDISDAETLFRDSARVGVKRFVLLSSAAIYGASHHNIGFLAETRAVPNHDKRSVAHRWSELESLAVFYLGGSEDAGLTILRPAPVLLPDGDDYFNRLMRGRVAVTLAGHDPSLQFLSPEDLASAVRRVVETGAGGIFNLSPDGVIPLREALRLAGVKRLPVPRTLQRAGRALLSRVGLCHTTQHLDYVRYSWTVSNEKAKKDIEFSPARSSAQAIRELRAAKTPKTVEGDACAKGFDHYDDFGMDEAYIKRFGRTLFKFLHDKYWRIEVEDFHHVPSSGRAVLVGVHRGFMPWDAVMTLHLFASRLGRYPRFLIHPGLVRFPFLFNFHTKLGGVIACQENADRILSRDGILAIYPEGIRGAFTMYRDAYRLGRFGRDEFVKMALRHRTPIIPFITVGSAEIFPIIGKLDIGWWKRNTEWPFFPITPTWPILPLPLPSKWHTQFLTPIHVERRYPPEAADDPATVRALSREVRARMEAAISSILSRRKSIFYGSVFGQEASR